MCETPVPFKCAKGMLADGLPSFVIVWILFDVVVIDIYSILVLAALYDAFGKFGALVF